MDLEVVVGELEIKEKFWDFEIVGKWKNKNGIVDVYNLGGDWEFVVMWGCFCYVVDVDGEL